MINRISFGGSSQNTPSPKIGFTRTKWKEGKDYDPSKLIPGDIVTINYGFDGTNNQALVLEKPSKNTILIVDLSDGFRITRENTDPKKNNNFIRYSKEGHIDFKA